MFSQPFLFLIISTSSPRLPSTIFSFISLINVMPRLEIIEPAQTITMKMKKIRQILLNVAEALANPSSPSVGTGTNCVFVSHLKRVNKPVSPLKL
jgi:hypothetical protein